MAVIYHNCPDLYERQEFQGISTLIERIGERLWESLTVSASEPVVRFIPGNDLVERGRLLKRDEHKRRHWFFKAIGWRDYNRREANEADMSTGMWTHSQAVLIYNNLAAELMKVMFYSNTHATDGLFYSHVTSRIRSAVILYDREYAGPEHYRTTVNTIIYAINQMAMTQATLALQNTRLKPGNVRNMAAQGIKTAIDYVGGNLDFH